MSAVFYLCSYNIHQKIVDLEIPNLEFQSTNSKKMLILDIISRMMMDSDNVHVRDTKHIWPEIRSIYFASFLLAMSFSPYLVLITRRAFQGNYLSLIDAAKTNGILGLLVLPSNVSRRARAKRS